MDVDTVQVRIKELEQLILQAKEAYYNGTPTVTDEVYDAWADELSDLDGLNQVLAQVGALVPAVTEWSKVKHLNPMGSLNKVNTLEEVTEWVQSNAQGEPLLVSEKLDGISIQVQYVSGKLVQASTRGDGYIGEDITANVIRMKGAPEKLSKRVSCHLRGEIVILRSDFDAWFKSEYAGTRNAASGISKRYDGKGCEHLTVMFYQVMSTTLPTAEENFRYIEGLGLRTPSWYLSGMWLGVRTPHDIWVEYQQTKRDKLDYEIDGLVVEVNDLSKKFALGEKDLRPEGAVAFKFAPITRETTVRGFVCQTGGTGRITPVANFDQVNLLGAKIENASVYNQKYINTLGLGVGAKVLVARANDVIPRIVALVKGNGPVFSIPSTCSSCGSQVVQDGEFHVCPNKQGCPAQVVGRVSHWISSLGILEWGDTLIEKLVASNLVKTIPDLYRLTEAQVAGLDRMGATSTAKVLKLLHEKKSLPLDHFLGSLSIPGVATSTIKTLMDAGLDTFERLQGSTLEKIASVKGIGPVKAASLVNWVRTQGNVVQELSSVGVVIEAPIRGKFSGMYFCFTGETKTKRSDLESMVKAHGGEVKSSVTKKLTYLVLSDTTTTKARTAEKYGTKCISEEEFLALVKG